MPHNWADNVVEDDITAVVDGGGGEAPKEQENLDEEPEGDQARVLWGFDEAGEDHIQGEAECKDYKVPDKQGGIKKEGFFLYGGINSTYLSQERQASVSQACKEFVERVAGRKRHRRMQGREESESEVDFVEEDEDKDADEDMADMKYGILATM